MKIAAYWGGMARASSGCVRMMSSASRMELRGSVFSRVDGVERFWSAASGNLVGWSPKRIAALEVPQSVLGHGTQVGIADGGNNVAVLLEWRNANGRCRRIVVVDVRDGQVVVARGWGPGGDAINGAGAVPGLAMSSSGRTIAHGDGRSLLVWRIDAPAHDHAPPMRGTPRWVNDEMDCLVDDGQWWRFHAFGEERTHDVKIPSVPSHASWVVARDLSVATTHGHRALVSRNGSDLATELKVCTGVLAPGPNGCVAAIHRPAGKTEQMLSVIDREGTRWVLGRQRGSDWRTLAFSSDGAKLAVVHADRVDIHPVPRFTSPSS